jgi:hypothetical protein
MGTAANHRQVCTTALTYQSVTPSSATSASRRPASAQILTNSARGTRTLSEVMRSASEFVRPTA